MRNPIATSLVISTVAAIATGSALAADVRLTHDDSLGGGYVSTYTLATGNPYTDAT